MILLMLVHLDPESHSTGAAPRPTAVLFAADRAGAAPFAPAPVAGASGGCRRDRLTIAPKAPLRPQTPPGACSAASRAAPARRTPRHSSAHRRAHRAGAAPPHRSR